MNFFRGSLPAWVALILLFCVCGRVRAAEVIPPAPTQYFNDYAGIVQPATAQAINTQLEQFERDTSNQILVVIYPHMQSDSSVEDYTVRVAEAWGVGQKARSNGAILFVFAQDHKLRIETGYGLEGALPDALCKQIIDEEIVPLFRKGDFSGGIQAGVSAILAAVQHEYHGNGSTVADTRGASGSGTADLIRICLFLAFVIIWSIARSRQHVVYNGVGRSSLWAIPMIFMGGGFGGGGGGGGGFGGGFSGGGGGFGGGGAGGSW